MKKLFAASMALAMLSGCSGLTGVTTGSKTTTYYPGSTEVATVEEKTAIGDPNTEYYGAIKAIADHSAKGLQARADAIKEAAAINETDSEEAKAWKGAFAALAISTMQDRTSENITSVHKATTGYDVADHAVGAVKDIATVGLPVYGAVRAIKYMSQGMGDSTSVSTTGDGNGFESNKVHIVNETTSSVSGSESNPTVSATPSATNASPSTSETTTETPLVQ